MKNMYVDTLTVLRALVLSRLFLFLSANAIYTGAGYAGVSMSVWSGVLTLMDLPALVLVWAMRPGWEDPVRAFTLVWTVFLSFIVWSFGWGLVNAGLIVTVNILIVIAIARPNSLGQSQSEVAPQTI